MICNRDLRDIILVLFLPFQFQFLHDFYLQALENVQAKSTDFNVPFSQTEAAVRIFFAAATVSSVISVFVYYRIKKRRLFLSICFMVNAVVWLAYLGFNEKKFWLAIFLRICNGIFVGIFHTISISYLFSFIYNEYVGFYGYLIQTVMFLALVIVYLLFSFLDYKPIAVIFAIQDLILAGLIFFLPEVQVPFKRITGDYIFARHNLKNLFITVMLMVFQQFCGINIVLRKVPKMMEGIGLDMKITLQYVFTDTVGFLSDLIGAFASVSISRKIMWCLSSLGCFVGLILFGVTLITDDLPNWVGTLGAFLFYTFYGLGQGPIAWYYGGELFPDSLRIEAGAATLITNQVFTIVYTYLEKAIFKKFDEIGSVILCMAFDFIAIFFGMIFIPTHKNREFENDNFL